MTPEIILIPRFVEYIPAELEEGTLYISIEFATASHKCACGCGLRVVTPFSPTDWSLVFDGVSVSLDPSIGNWSFPCQSHYWVKRNKIHWAPKWSRERIEAGRNYDSLQKRRYLEKSNEEIMQEASTKTDRVVSGDPKITLWQRIRKMLFR